MSVGDGRVRWHGAGVWGARCAVGLAAVVGAVLAVSAAASASGGSVTFDGSPGTGPSPLILGPYSTQAFTPSGTNGQVVTSAAGPTGAIAFPSAYFESLPYADGTTGFLAFPPGGSVTSFHVMITLPAATGAFYLYAGWDCPACSGDPGAVSITAAVQDGTSSGPMAITGQGATYARYFGFYAGCGSALSSVTLTLSGTGYAPFMTLGAFGIAPVSANTSCGTTSTSTSTSSTTETTTTSTRTSTSPPFTPTLQWVQHVKQLAATERAKYADDVKLWDEEWKLNNCPYGNRTATHSVTLGTCYQILYLRDQAKSLEAEADAYVRDPPDANFTKIPQPRPVPTKAIPGRQFKPANELIHDLAKIAALEAVLGVCKDRETGALQAGDSAAVNLQQSGIVKYARDAIALTTAIGKLARAALKPLASLGPTNTQALSDLLAANSNVAAAMKILTTTPLHRA